MYFSFKVFKNLLQVLSEIYQNYDLESTGHLIFLR